ncbi:phosphate signaling complex protein PhoU [Thiolinea disciformis]|uniref:phosphate signaling complex protein PhoU n=1 Tax=Thiolinea disciformis TaxID=125614 RepID=UPI000369CC84|nr:phosphate signaling complex protein PhoU [Thiolinea disciformis]
MDIGHHTSQQYNHELEDVRNMALQMGGLVEEQLNKAMRALMESDSQLAEEVVNSDYKVNRLEVQIDEVCAKIIARRQPAASDLRLLISIIKSVTDLERMGDEAEKIARYALTSQGTSSPASLHSSLRHLGNEVRDMLRDALDTMARMDAEKAKVVGQSDERIDAEFDYLSRELLTHMMEDPRNIKQSLNTLWCARALERIGDHSRNICEYVIYLVEGKDVRHTAPKNGTIPAI